jgi:ribonucleoside-diphosphate reductase subunit M2
MSTTVAALPPTETPSKAAANKLAKLDFDTTKDGSEPSLLSKMQATSTPTMSTKDASRTHNEIILDSGKVIQHASLNPSGAVRKYVGDLSITDDKQEPLLQESEQRFVLFPIKYHEVSDRSLRRGPKVRGAGEDCWVEGRSVA